MSDQQAFDEIADAINRLRRAFLRNGMKAPVSIELGDKRDKDAFVYLMPRDLVMTQVRTWHDPANPELVANIFGVEVRMPAQWRLKRDGGKEAL